MPSASERFNIADHLPRAAAERPHQRAVVVPAGRDAAGRRLYAHATVAQLYALADRYAHGMSRSGVAPGDKVLLMVRPSIEFAAIAFALFRMGTLPVLIDPGMGRDRLLDCIRGVAPDALVGIPLAHAARLLKPAAFRSVRRAFVVGGRFPLAAIDLEAASPAGAGPFEGPPTTRGSDAAILFTSGSTGPAKGVLYSHGMFDAQVRMIRDLYDIRPGEIDLPGLPIFALFDVALGMTTIIPDMDPSRPATVDPARIVEAVEDHGVTVSFGSPAIWRRVAEHCLARKIRLPSIRRLLMAGAPVPGDLMTRFREILVNGEVHTPYGATESLPVSSIGCPEVIGPRHAPGGGAAPPRPTWLATREGFGTCVGRPVPGIDLRVIRLTDDPIPAWRDDLELPPGEIGEAVVAGEPVTREYYGDPAATSAAKIAAGDRFFHRIGDAGYLDRQGRFWFCGRKSHRVETSAGTLYTIPCEAIFNRHPRVARTALVGVGAKGAMRPVLVVEPRGGRVPKLAAHREKFERELLELGKGYEHTRGIDTILFHPAFPVDVRHNAKIFREKLAAWAAQEIARAARG